jgi:hypothetical protein
MTGLQLGWYNIRVPVRPCYSLTERPGYLALWGSATTIDVDHNPSVLLRKQLALNVDWSTEVEFKPYKKGQEAGTLVWLSSKTHAVVAIRGADNGNMEIIYRGPGEDKKLSVSSRPHQLLLIVYCPASHTLLISSFVSTGEGLSPVCHMRNTGHTFHQGSSFIVRILLRREG